MKKIALIVCWLGKFPKWHNLYLLTCLRNPEVDWIIFHDQPTPSAHPKNVIFHSLQTSGIEARATRVLGTNVLLHSSYKLCDLRPAYGAMFHDYLEEYLFWGYADNDVFFGRVGAFLTEQLLSDHDVITACRCCTSGQFTIFRNSGILKDAYRLIPNYIDAIKTTSYAGLDEIPLDNALQACQNQSIRVSRRQLQIFDVCSEEWRLWAERLELEEKGHLKDLFWEGGATEWNAGKITHITSGKEAMFMHFMTWKRKWLIPSFPYWPGVIQRFVVRENGIEVLFAREHWLYQFYFALRYQTPVQILRLARRVEATSVGRQIRGRLGRLKRWVRSLRESGGRRKVSGKQTSDADV